jgi:energy-converting hydrogenase Eha subunit G
MGGKAMFFPAPEMAVLGEIVYFMIFGTITIGAVIGGGIVHFWNKRKIGK